MNINFAMRNIVITANDKFASRLSKIIKKYKKFIKPLVFISLSYFTSCAGWIICIDDRHRTNVDTQYSSFKITLLNITSVNNIIGFYFSKDGNAAISLFLRRKPICIKS